ncbi:phosphogluconate dehydrogenase (NAD(+)-dependent, decarboxylating) [Haploplasma axanthum]|nr:decarboxylating 6-phosphogluconate dehydrogenase [Haploplasma axanthum]
MKIRLIGLGKMGENIALNLIDHKHTVYGYDISEETRKKLINTKIEIKNSYKEVLEREGNEKIVVWMLVPNQFVTNVIEDIKPFLKKGDIIIDAGNSNYNLSVKRYHELKEQGLNFIDVGTSGGTYGARNGACLMVGGDYNVVKEIEQVFVDISIENGYGYFGEAGAGHYVKMVHNGIEYGMMQAIGEGLELVEKSQYDVDFEKLTKVWNHGSIIESALIGYMHEAFKNDPKLETLEGRIDDSGEGKWTVEEALRLEVSMPVITNSLFVRYKSRDLSKFSEKSVAAMRKVFGGHAIYKKK